MARLEVQHRGSSRLTTREALESVTAISWNSLKSAMQSCCYGSSSRSVWGVAW
jgi:hypothetical protein